jgi:hypothetical protein
MYHIRYNSREWITTQKEYQHGFSVPHQEASQ